MSVQNLVSIEGQPIEKFQFQNLSADHPWQSLVSAADQNRRDLRDFSAFGNDPWPMTAELIEMAQYISAFLERLLRVTAELIEMVQ